MTFINLHEQRADALSSDTDTFFRYVDEESEVESDGDVESPYGHFRLLEIDPDAIEKLSDFAGHEETRITPGWYITVTNSDGVIWTFDYRGTGIMPEENARAAFEAHAEAYRDWYIENNEEN